MLVVAAAPARADTPLGGVELDAYCKSVGYQGVVLEGSASGTNAAYNWRCYSGSTRVGLSVTNACRWQYGDPNAYAVAQDLDDAYSWRCYTTTVAPPPPSGGGGGDTGGGGGGGGKGGGKKAKKSTYVADCSDFKAKRRPQKLILTCRSANMFVEKMKWRRWGSGSAATRKATLRVNDCDPYCGAGTFHHYEARVKLSKARSCSHTGKRQFRKVKVKIQGAVTPPAERRSMKFPAACEPGDIYRAGDGGLANLAPHDEVLRS